MWDQSSPQSRGMVDRIRIKRRSSGLPGTGILNTMNRNQSSSRPSILMLAFVWAFLAGVVEAQETVPASPEEVVDRPWWRFLETEPLLPETLGANGLPTGWVSVGGDARYEIEVGEDGETILRGIGGGPRNTFLVDPRITGDFLLEFEVLIDRGGGNSGVQIRSAVETDRMFGYQIEIDPSERSWSGGLYDEGRRGWLASLEDSIEARDSFVPGRWNRYTVLAVGPRIRTWINDVPAVDHVDFMDSQGRIGLQVHSGHCDVRWRRLRIADLGVRTPKSVITPGNLSGVDVDPQDGMKPGDGSFDPSVEGVTVTVTEPMPEAPSGFDLSATIRRGAVRIELGDVENGPGYVLTVPGPLGRPGKPGMIRIRRSPDSMRVFVDDVPMVPGPPNLEGPLMISIEIDGGTIASIHEMTVTPPTALESRAIEEWKAAKLELQADP